jgi:Fe-S-cluster containining protein
MKHFNNKLDKLYIKMDKAFETAASHYGFICNGCEDNCCKSFFYHHTFIEKDYLLSIANDFSPDKKIALKKNAEIYLDVISYGNTEFKEKPLCPLNKNSKCVLYNQRPMICRLHGIPHHLNIPGKDITKNPGCNAGLTFFNSTKYFPFDRIPFYQEMAEIEKEYRQKFTKSGKIKQTIAHMLLDLSL